jgi:hypothetical protein
MKSLSYKASFTTIALLVTSAVITLAPVNASAKLAGYEKVDYQQCLLTEKQDAMGFECWVMVETNVVHRTIGSGGGTKCQEGTQVVLSFLAYNKNGWIMDTRSTWLTAEFGDTGEQIEWNGNHTPGACTTAG